MLRIHCYVQFFFNLNPIVFVYAKQLYLVGIVRIFPEKIKVTLVSGLVRIFGGCGG